MMRWLVISWIEEYEGDTKRDRDRGGLGTWDKDKGRLKIKKKQTERRHGVLILNADVWMLSRAMLIRAKKA